MKNVIKVIKEQIDNFYLLIRLSFFEVKSANTNNYLGIAWELLNPLIQLGVYWLVFGLGIRGNSDVDGVPFLQWLLAGMTAWFFIHASIMGAMKSIYSRIALLSKMNFPFSSIPLIVILQKFYSHLMVVAAVAVIFLFKGVEMDIHFIQIFYYMFATIVYLYSLSLITSSLAALVRDTVMIVQAILRMMLYVTPLLWVPNMDRLPFLFQAVLMINPLAYLVAGYRYAFLGGGWFFEDVTYTLYFWALVLLQFIIGAAIHMKFRRHFIDYL